jgi:RHS repeat-associated protein
LYAKFGLTGVACKTKSYYMLGATRVAMREVTDDNGQGAVFYLHGDHLGSVSMVTGNSAANRTGLINDGRIVGSTRYKPWGEERQFVAATAGFTPTDFRFTGQRKADVGTGTPRLGPGIYDYNARFYDATIGRFLSADTIVPEPGDPQSFNRYSYSFNSPTNYTDPSGHRACRNQDDCEESGETPNGNGRSIVPGVSIPGWQSKHRNSLSESQRRAAIEAFKDFLENPDYYVMLYATGQWNDVDSTEDLATFAEYSELAMPVDTLVLGYACQTYGQEICSGIQAASRQAAFDIAAYGRNPLLDEANQSGPGGSVHGNSKSSSRLTYLYVLEDGQTGQPAKFGVTQDPNRRYSRTFLGSRYSVRVIDYGTRVEMLDIERTLIRTSNLPLNREKWKNSWPGPIIDDK